MNAILKNLQPNLLSMAIQIPSKIIKVLSFILLGLLVFPQAVFAHPGHSESNFVGGFIHPLTGLDHILAMLAVGLWAFQRGGRCVWALPMVFVTLMMTGGMMSLGGLPLRGVEFMILLSVVVLGAMVAIDRKVPFTSAAVIVGAFALFHGHAHLNEMAGASATTYTLGFIASTLLLHGLGLAFGFAVKRTQHATRFFRHAGALIALMGLMLISGL